MRALRRPARPSTVHDDGTRRRPGRGAVAALLVTLAVLAGALVPARQDALADRAGSVIGQVDGWPLWLEAGRSATASVLMADGTIWWVAGPDAAPARLLRGAVGEQLVACGAALLVVDERGALRRLPRSPDLPVVVASGPAASRYHRPACLPDGGVAALDPNGDVLLLDRSLAPLARAPVAALPDAELVTIDLGGTLALAVLSAPTQRYRHGTLGDEVEAGAVTLLSLPDLAPLATWRPPFPAVIEDRRVAPWRTAPTGVDDAAVGLDVTVSDEASGARLVRLAWDGDDLVVVAQGDALGASQRWLHHVGSADAVSYAVHEPRAGGPLVRYDHVGDAWRSAAFDLGVASHVDGERLLDRAVLLGPLGDGAHLLVVPRADQRALRWLRCDADACEVVREDALPSGLSTNLSPGPPSGVPQGVVAGERDGTVWWLPSPLPLDATAPDPGER